MKRRVVAMFALSIFLCTAAEAQLGDLKGKLKGAIKKQAGKSGDSKDISAGRPGPNKDTSRKYAPGLSFSTVLNGVTLRAPDGKFRLNNIQGTFIPDDCKEGCVVLRKAEGEELVQFDWRPDRLKKPYCILSVFKITDLKTGKEIPAFVDLSAPGDYVLDFYLPEEHFYTFPFTVAKIAGDDPFGDAQAFVLNGDWSKYGYLYYPQANASQSLHWKVWMRSGSNSELAAKIRLEIKRDGDGELVCTNREGTNYTFKPDWVRYDFDTVFPEGKEVPHGTYFKAKDLLAVDGAYTLTMALNDKPYGEWKFEIADGKLKYKGRTVRGKADALTFIEGGRDAWWFEKK